MRVGNIFTQTKQAYCRDKLIFSNIAFGTHFTEAKRQNSFRISLSLLHEAWRCPVVLVLGVITNSEVWLYIERLTVHRMQLTRRWLKFIAIRTSYFAFENRLHKLLDTNVHEFFSFLLSISRKFTFRADFLINSGRRRKAIEGYVERQGMHV